MARSGTIQTSVPQIVDDEIEDENYPDDGESEDAAAAELAAVEAEAYRGGWRPLAEYRGKPGGWVDAKTFIERGNEYLPFVKKERDQLRTQVAGMTTEFESMRGELAQTRQDMQKLLKFSREANQAGYDRAVAELKKTQREAAVNGDVATFDAATEQLDQMHTARAGSDEPPASAEPLPTPKPKVANVPQEIVDFVDANPWYKNDAALGATMIDEHNKVIKRAPGMALADQLEEAKEAVMRRFPEKFGLDPEAAPPTEPVRRRPQAPLAPTPGARPARLNGKTGIDAIEDQRERAEAREGFKRARRNMPELTEAEYLEVFNDPHGDVLDVIDRHKPKDQRSARNGR